MCSRVWGMDTPLQLVYAIQQKSKQKKLKKHKFLKNVKKSINVSWK